MGGTLNEAELRRYLQRIGDRWPLDRAIVGGARVADARGALPQRERGPEWVVLLVSDAFDGMPWLERVYQAGSLWDASEMGAPADVHAYTPRRVRAQGRVAPAREADGPLRAGPARRARPRPPIATMRSIGTRARSATSAGTFTSWRISRRRRAASAA